MLLNSVDGLGKGASLPVQVDHAAAAAYAEVAVAGQQFEDGVQAFPVGEEGQETLVGDALIGYDDGGAEGAFQVGDNVLEGNVDETEGAVVGKSLEVFGRNTAEGDISALAVVLDHVSRGEAYIPSALSGRDVQAHGTFAQHDFYYGSVPVGLEVEDGAVYAYFNVSGVDDKGLFGILCNLGQHLTIQEDFAFVGLE